MKRFKTKEVQQNNTEFPEDAVWEGVPTLQNNDEVLAYSTPTTFGPSNMSAKSLTNRTAYLKVLVEDLPATQQEVNERIIGNKYVSPATLPQILIFLKGMVIDYTEEASTLTGTGWYPCNGSLYDIASPQGQVLNNFSAATKLRYNLEVVGDKIRIHDLITSDSWNDGGYIRRAVEDGKQGTKQSDQIQAHQHIGYGPSAYFSTSYGPNYTVKGAQDTYEFKVDPNFPNAGDPRIGNETRMLNMGFLPIVYLGV